jgi:hypothetical protein
MGDRPNEAEAMRHVFAVFVFYLLFILAGITYFMVIGVRHL